MLSLNLFHLENVREQRGTQREQREREIGRKTREIDERKKTRLHAKHHLLQSGQGGVGGHHIGKEAHSLVIDLVVVEAGREGEREREKVRERERERER